VFFVGLLAKQEYIFQVYGGYHADATGDTSNIQAYPYGAFYPGGGGRLLACQIIGILVIFGWVAANMIPFFYIFKVLGMLRISAEEEAMGLDASKHGGSAYNGAQEGSDRK
jgi:Amt family ammonium transporter